MDVRKGPEGTRGCEKEKFRQNIEITRQMPGKERTKGTCCVTKKRLPVTVLDSDEVVLLEVK